MPVDCGPPTSVSTSVIGTAVALEELAVSNVAMSGSGPSTSSTIEFHASHDGQRPAHFGYAVAHALQR